MFKFFQRLKGGKPAEPPRFSAEVLPKRPLYVIGDIHGRDDLFDPVLEKIVNHSHGIPHDLVTVGDYVDRGEGSAGVLSRLKKMSELPNVTCLMGNHERMLLDFIDDPAKNGRRWIRNGGLQTLASFGVGGLTETSGVKTMIGGRDTFLEALGPLEPWLRTLPFLFQSGNVAVVHAGADPSVPLSDQPEKNLLWGHPMFSQTPREDGIWVIHGHTIVETAVAKAGRISVDTGAYATGRLTVAVVRENEQPLFL